MARILEGRNRPTASEAASFVDKFEALEARIATEKAKYMLACKAIRTEQKDLLDDAKGQGVGKGIVKAIHKARVLTAKAKAAMDALEDPDDRDYADEIRKALGDFADLPLGAAAVDGAEKSTAEAAAEAMKADMGDDEWNAAGQVR